MSNDHRPGLGKAIFGRGFNPVRATIRCLFSTFAHVMALLLPPACAVNVRSMPREADCETIDSCESLWEYCGFITSFAIHMATILILGMIVTPTHKPSAVIAIISHPSPEEPTSDFCAVELTDLPSKYPTSLDDRADAEAVLSGITLESLIAEASVLPNAPASIVPHAYDQDIGLVIPDAGSLLTAIDNGTKGSGLLSEAIGAEVEFYGVKASGRRFVFVTDCSSSMGGQSLQRLKQELQKSLRNLPARAEFYIVFFNERAIPMASSTCVPATPQHLRTHLAWVDQVQSIGGTDPSEAMKVALTLKPSVVFLLTDGMFEPEPTEAMISRLNKDRKIRINTIAIGDRGAELVLQRIAKENNGTFTFISK